MVLALTWSELLARLGSRRAVEVALAQGAWSRVLRDAYVAGPVDLPARAAAAALVLPTEAVVADRSALWLVGVDLGLSAQEPLEVVVPRGLQRPRRQGLRSREAAVPAADVHVVRGVRALRPARAAVDLMRRPELVEAVVVADACLHAHVVTAAGLQHRLDQAAGQRWVAVARQAAELADARAESPMESRVRVPLVLAGLPVVPQHEVRDPAGLLVARVDLAVPELRIAIEYDGRAAHGASAFAPDRRRQNALVALGWTVLRLTAADLADPVRLVRQVRALIAAAAAA